jgi:dihydroxyacetone kinase
VAPASAAPRELGDTGVGAAPAAVDPATLDVSGRMARAALEAMQETLDAIEAELGDLDARAGDGDHGATMVRGIAGAVDAARRAGPGAAAVLGAAGMAFADAAGGAAGALWGAVLTATGSRLATGACDAELLAGGLEDARDAVARLGGAAVGDKTMLDALDPFVSTYAAAVAEGASLADAWTRAAGGAARAATATARLRPRLGRAARQADRSVGVPDPGATSFAAAVRAMTSALDGSRGPAPEVIR